MTEGMALAAFIISLFVLAIWEIWTNEDENHSGDDEL